MGWSGAEQGIRKIGIYSLQALTIRTALPNGIDDGQNISEPGLPKCLISLLLAFPSF